MFNFVSALDFLVFSPENTALFILYAFLYIKMNHKFDLMDKEIKQVKKEGETSINVLKTELEKSMNHLLENLGKNISHIKTCLNNHITDTNKKRRIS